MTHIFNQKPHTPLRRILRNQVSKPELVMWQYLRRKQLKGYKFRRQVGIGRYVVDFYCPNAKLAIEIDGESHYIDDAPAQDRVRQEEIEALGVRILRFTNTEVMENIEKVVEEIVNYLSV